MHTFVRRPVRGAFALLAGLMLAAAGARAQETLRPEVGKPLQAAQDLIKAQKYKEALAKVRDADGVANKSGNESYTVERMRIAAASGAGDLEAASRSFEALNASGRLAPADKLRFIESIAGIAYRARDYAGTEQWAQRYAKEGGTNPIVRTLLIQSEYQTGDFAEVAKQVSVDVSAAEKAGTPPSEERLKLLLNAATKLNDTSRYVYAVEKLLTYYPRKEYWGDLLSRLQNKPNFSERFALDTYRLALATGSLRGADDYVEMAQLAAQAGFPEEGKQVVDKGFAAGVLGSGPEASRHQRLRDLLARRSDEDKAARAQAEAQALAAPDGNALVNLGYKLAVNGQGAKGLSLMQQGISKGGLAAGEVSKLRLGIAQVLSGDAGKANATFRTVSGNDGASDLARLWALYARSKPAAA